jgi:hypothetical protein
MKIQKALVKKILEKAELYEWSLQGFGMLRLHLDYDVRLNVWDSRYRVPNVSLMHTHPWNFKSVVVAGRLNNTRYWKTPPKVEILESSVFEYAVIKPGLGGGLREHLGILRLRAYPIETFKEGESYEQVHDEIHISDPSDGTVTVNERQRVGDDLAYVYWPAGTEWVSAEPRPGKLHEVRDITEAALKKWF